jgi:hypothetical protein
MDVPTVLERKDRDSGMTELWLSHKGERLRFMMVTVTLDGPTGAMDMTSMANEHVRRLAEARELGKLRIEA